MSGSVALFHLFGKLACRFFAVKLGFHYICSAIVQKPDMGKWAGADIMESVYMTLDS